MLQFYCLLVALSIEVFLFNTNPAFLTFLYNIDIKGFWKVSAKNKVAPSENITHNTNHHWIRIPLNYVVQTGISVNSDPIKNPIEISKFLTPDKNLLC